MKKYAMIFVKSTVYPYSASFHMYKRTKPTVIKAETREELFYQIENLQNTGKTILKVKLPFGAKIHM